MTYICSNQKQKTMNSYSLSQIKALRLVAKTEFDFKDLYTDTSSMNEYRTSLDAVLEKIDKRLDKLSGINTGPTKDKAIKELLMVKAALKISGSGFNYADDIHDYILKEKMSITKSDFADRNETEKKNLATMVYNELSPALILAALEAYRVKPADMTDLQTKTSDYNDTIVNPQINIYTGADLRQEIRQLIKDGFMWVDKFEKMMGHFEDTEFHTMFFKSKNIIDRSHRYKKPLSFIKGRTINFDDESELLHTEVFIQGEEKYREYSDEEAMFTLGAHQEGEQLLVAVKPGFKRWEEVVEIKKGEDIEMDIDLEAEEPVTSNTEEPPMA
jgi:hypothetical protein